MAGAWGDGLCSGRVTEVALEAASVLKNPPIKRSISIEMEDGESIELPLKIVTAIKTDKKMIHLDELPDGSWRLIYNSKLIPDMTKVLGFKIIREG